MSFGRVGFVKRTCAFILDVIFIITLTTLISALINIPKETIANTYAFVILVLVWGFIEAITGCTPGKKIFSIKVKMSSGLQANFTTLLLRSLLKYNLPIIIFFITLAFPTRTLLKEYLLFYSIVSIFLINLIFLAAYILILTKNKQGLHDKICNTAVYAINDYSFCFTKDNPTENTH
ncbi:RDD family protein [Candidatus Uabimicrobium sp. HlEnr_7]|uniref:RDD family protein n=1 Tax=Candidatus Uabimicrobium helgolandensis TaxID=3095367 RepID=UPI003557E45D